MKNLKDNLYFINKKPLELEYFYVYNQYKENEFTQEDILISIEPQENTLENSSYIQIEVLQDSGDYSNQDELNNFIFNEKLEEIASYLSLPIHIERLFNIPDTFNSKKAYLTLDVNFNDFFLYFDMIENIDEDDLSAANTAKRLNIEKSFIARYINSNKKSSFYSEKDDDSLKNYSSLFDNENQNYDINSELSTGKFLGNYKIYNKKNQIEIEDKIDQQTQENFFEKFVGYYIVKYKKDAVFDSEYEKVSSRFVQNQGSTLSLKDFYVKYSQVYKYYVYPVYSLTIKSYNNFYYDQLLICGYPLITEDIEAIETKKPNYPAGPFVKIDKETINLEISWKKPLERQEDVKGYQVFKRYNINEPFVLIQELRGHLSVDRFTKDQNILDEVIDATPGNIKHFFVDTEFDSSKINIYAISSIDAHGLTSNYSTQIGVVYDLLLDKLIIDHISDAGAPIEYPNILIPRKTKYFDNEDSIISNVPLSSKKNKFSLYFTPDAGKVKSKFIGAPGGTLNVINDNTEFSLSIFRVNGQKSILIDEKCPTIKIQNFN